MARLVMVIEVDDSVDPARTDPAEIAEELVSVHQEEGRHGDIVADVTALVSAEWDTP